MSYDAGNEQLNLDTTTYSYDLNGNRIQMTQTGGVLTTYTYDDENRLTQISQGSTVIAYTYDPFGRRISKNVKGTITNYVYDNDHIIAEYNSAGTIQTKYTHGPGIDEPLARTQNTTTYFYHADGLGSIMALTNTSGKQAQVYTYNAFGKITHIVGPSVFSTIVQPYAYTGREYDSESGLYFYRARYYDPQGGRFLQRDPIGFGGGINFYTYVKNNPIKYRDPKGLDCYSDAIDAFITCSAGLIFISSLGVDIAVAGCIFTGPAMVPCMATVLEIAAGPELLALAACGMHAKDIYDNCKKKCN